MKKLIYALTAVTFLLTLSSHDMFLKMESYHVKPNSNVSIHLYNGTFDKSENSITRDRMADVSLVKPDGSRTRLPNNAWSDVDNITVLETKTSGEGTYVVGVSTLAKMIDLSATDFNQYLAHDGIVDVLEARKSSGEDQQAANEKYSKHVKAIFQATSTTTNNFNKELGYPIEFIPLQNPYDLSVGEKLSVKLLFNGKPVKNQLVYASYAGYHSHSDSGGHVEAISSRTDENGMVSIELSKEGHWYVRTIYMVKSNEAGVDYESNWATLTFEISS